MATAIISCDFQYDILSRSVPGETGALLERAASVLSAARAHHMPVFHVAVRFRPGYPEISPDNKMFSGVKSGGGMLVEGTHGAAIHEAVAPQGGEPVVVKRRVGAFSTTDLATLLRARDIKHIVLMGVSTSGVILSSVRWAADADFRITVIADCCADRDEEVHHVLTTKVFLRQADVTTAAEFVSSLSGV